MTRTEKLERIRKYRPRLYASLKKKVPSLVVDPNYASQYDIDIYNKHIEKISKEEKNVSFQKNFSF